MLKVQAGAEYVTLVDFWTAYQEDGIVEIGDYTLGYDPGELSVRSACVLITPKDATQPIRFFPQGSVPDCVSEILAAI